MFILTAQTIRAQEQSEKTIRAVRTEHAPKIDGNPDKIWDKAPVATGFYEFQPGNGNPADPAYKTEVRILYDNSAIYVLAKMYDPDPSGISTEFSLRDQFVPTDIFMFYVNPFLAPGNNYFFGVTATGAQMDGINTNGRDDHSWNAVWNSATYIGKKAWYAELAIPYSALRFQNEPEQTWGVNFIRLINRTRKIYSWTFIDKTKSGDVVQFMGRLTGLKNIQSPVRLSLYPYASANLVKYKGATNLYPGFGMDLKYGLTENFTLDATLIPDFSDVPYDDIVLNLGPFEQYYNENRPFFTEGMQLFNRGRLFYSRRIGSTPMRYYNVYGELVINEIIIKNPDKSQLINALKISGRTKSGLGIGVLNAVTTDTYATVEDTVTNKIRKIQTDALTNYNVSVLDYAFGKNNSVGIINTNVLRKGDFPDANVTGTFFDINTMNNTLNINGRAVLSVKHVTRNTPGFASKLEIEKKFGRHNVAFSFNMADTRYDINDLGYMRKNNYVIYDFDYEYRILKPTKHFNGLNISASIGLDHIFKPYMMFRKDFSFGIFATNKKYLSFGFRDYVSSDMIDFYEPRVPGRYYIRPAYNSMHIFISSDYRKRFALDAGGSFENAFQTDYTSAGVYFSPRFRLSNRFKLIYSLRFSDARNDRGFVTVHNGDILFGKRDQRTFTQKITANYFFTVKSGLSISARHYWSPVHYKMYCKLLDDGNLMPVYYNGNHDINFNIWNFDLGYNWEFAPGSQLTLLYRHSLFNTDRQYNLSYADNLDHLFRQPQKHSFILKMIYYIDYNTVRRKWF